jgi:hypothetical protein
LNGDKKNYQGFDLRVYDPATKVWWHQQEIINSVETTINKLGLIYSKVNERQDETPNREIEIPKFMMGSNGYYFIDGHRVDQQEYERQFDRWRVEEMNKKLDEVIKNFNYDRTK